MAGQLSDYELQRLQRIEANKKRMEQLGLVEAANDFSKQVLAAVPKRTKKAAPRKTKPDFVANAERRRSTRVAGLPAKTYDENVLLGADTAVERGGRINFSGAAEEVYTQKHVDALGSYEKEWELFVDGYDANGTRVYDSVNGKTCHQCRQKTMGKRTTCSECKSLVGQFCGDCLFMRYGENIDEVLAKPDWVCPVCRDLCNCSNHRIRKGWRPTGTLYRYVIDQGFKSVAHYLVLSNLAEPSSEASDNTAVGATTDSVAESSQPTVDQPKEPQPKEQQPAEQQPKEQQPAKEAKRAARTTALSAGNKSGGIDAVLPKRRASRATSKQVAASKEERPVVRRSSRAVSKA